MIRALHNKIVNSRLWYHIYYKHTAQHKAELKKVHDEVLRRRKEIIGK